MEVDKLIDKNDKNKLIVCSCYKNYSSLQFGMLTSGCKAKSHKCFCDKIINKLCFDDCVNSHIHDCICTKLLFPSGKVELCKASLHECICNITPLIDSKSMCRLHNK